MAGSGYLHACGLSESQNPMNPNVRNIALWAIILLLILALVSVFQSPTSRQAGQELPYSAFLDEVEKGRVERVTITGGEIHGTFRDTQQGFVTLASSIRASSRSCARRMSRRPSVRRMPIAPGIWASC